MRLSIKRQIAAELGIPAELIPDEAITFSEGSIVSMVDIGLIRKLNPTAVVEQRVVSQARSVVERGSVTVQLQGRGECSNGRLGLCDCCRL